MLKSKKSAEGIMWSVVIIAALLFFFLIYSNAWAGLFSKSASSLKEQIGSADDSDKDKIPNVADKCPCIAGDIENDGCPSNHKIDGTGTGKEDRTCLTKKT